MKPLTDRVSISISVEKSLLDHRWATDPNEGHFGRGLGIISLTRAAPRLSPEVSPATIAIVREGPGIEVMLSPPVVQRRLVRTSIQAGHRHKLSPTLSSSAYEG